MKNSKILIVEDDPFIADDLNRILRSAGYSMLTVCDNPNSAIKAMKEFEFNLALLDIHLNADIDGIELAQLSDEEYNCPIIFITAFIDEPTILKVSNINPQGYISKPYSQADILIGVELALRRSQNLVEKIKKESTINFVKTAQGLEKIDTNDIIYLEAYDYYAFMQLNNKKILITSTLKQLETVLACSNLCRIHRSFVVNIQKVSRVVGNELEVCGYKLPISRSYKEQFLEKLKII
jgi:DNA-binding LytR/AlgR family response regulator